MAYTLSEKDIERAVAFHGHMCPGLALGLRAAEWALEHIGRANDEDIVAITETDMCAVDAIQALVGCTLGKGNLIYKDIGKVAFSFYRRADGKSARLVAETPMSRRENDSTEPALEEKPSNPVLRRESIDRILTLPFEQIYTVKQTIWPLPNRARRMKTLICADCGEGVMESRASLLHDKVYCKTCFRAHDDR